MRYIPDYVSGTNPVNTPPGYCRHTNGTTNQACGTTFDPSYDEPMFASEFNRLYYNPNITYDPPVDGAGNQANAAFPDGACGPGFTTSCPTNYRSMTTRQHDGLDAGTARLVPVSAAELAHAGVWNQPTALAGINLTTKTNVRVFCNTDWPATAYVGPATATSRSGRRSATPTARTATPHDPGTGSHQRRGLPDQRHLLRRAERRAETHPATATTATTIRGRNRPGVNDPKYFWRNGGNAGRSGATRPARPGGPRQLRRPVRVTVAHDGRHGHGGAPVPQTCVFTSNANTTGAPYTYNPVGCETNPLYQWTWAVGGCVGTIGVECLACNRTGTSTSPARNATCSVTSTLDRWQRRRLHVRRGRGQCRVSRPAQHDADRLHGRRAGASRRATRSPAPRATRSTAARRRTHGARGLPVLLDDSNGAGVTCRHNQHSGAYVSTRFTYPLAPYTTVINHSTCGTIPTTVPVPPYYYTASSVEFCNAQKAQATEPNDQWRGFGKGACQAKNDQTTYRFVKYGTMTRVGLISGRTYAYTDPFTLVAGTRTYAEEMTNYANWYAYYRTRVLAAKTTSAIAFGNVDNTYRVGFHSMNLRNAGSTLAEWLDVGDFTPAQRTSWYTTLFGISIGTGMTPTIDAMFRIGEVVKQGAGAVTGLPAHTDPIPTIAGNPVSCTNNYHILFTDGETNQLTLPTVVGEVDGATIPARVVDGTLPPDPGAPNLDRTMASFVPGTPWPTPYRDVASPTPNTLADISLYYWRPRPAARHDQRRAVARRPRGQGSRLEARPGVVAARQFLGHLVRLGRPARLLRRRRQDRRRSPPAPRSGSRRRTTRVRRTVRTFRYRRPPRVRPPPSTTCGTPP